MKKQLLSATLITLFLASCGDETPATTENQATTQTTEQSQPVEKTEKKIKATLPEDALKDDGFAFTKNEKGTVIFEKVVDLFEYMGDYSLEDKDLKIVSQNPLHIQIFERVAGDNADVIDELQYKLIRDIYKVFSHTAVNEFTLEVIPVDAKTEKTTKQLAKITQKAKLNREKALEILQAFSAMTSFDDTVSFDENAEYTVIGLDKSKAFDKFNTTNLRPQIAKALKTGKVEIPEEEVQLPLDVDFTKIQVKLKQVFDLSLFDNDRRELADGRIEYSTPISDYVKVYAIGDKDQAKTIRQVAVQFVFSNDQQMIVHSLGGIGAAMLATPNPDKSFSAVKTMMEKAAKKLKKADKIEEVAVVDGLTLKLKVHPSLGGMAFLTIEKLEKRKIQFN
ncbi:hypothetical protein [Mannheimia sp. ZY171111]|uniref:hypothetical protein n=1 Tax=Mannheimia sp. ZY171111 TaxID=2679995 RepID=UPI001ADDB06B|nr:hypothetical protein [Mannheimia sp. ZY171111]QTM01911.1 hypothetical protein GM698_10110 [Mannheimia sp. ZY171111]